jgi:hypothetical protein
MRNHLSALLLVVVIGLTLVGSLGLYLGWKAYVQSVPLTPISVPTPPGV